ncbi:MATE family efflux transporter [Candidatus Sumerlaeota bacterium]|nr:MATE family efflux transporter [Candidatus Sumerlaeota bacterium]
MTQGSGWTASLARRWEEPAGYRQVLAMAVPLVLSTGSWSIQHFVDRMFLCWYSPDAMAASLPAGLFCFTLICFFMGTASYANTFVAQYHGSGQPRRVGPAVWQSIYFAIAAGLILPLAISPARAVFAFAGHAPAIQDLEFRYFRILILGSFFTVYTAGVSSFFTGLGRNWPVMWVNIGITVVNLTLDYALIFGHWGMPEMGIEGAAWATVVANGLGSLAFTVAAFSPANERRFATRSGWRFDRGLFARLMRYGAPSGAQFVLDILAFTVFIFLVGRIGTLELAASNVAFQINTLAFMPMIGFGIACSTLVGQRLGENRPDLAARATWSAFHLTFGYMATVAAAYVVAPSIFIDPFAAKADPEAFEATRRLATTMLYFVAAYSLLDTMNIVFSSALKGAGDTRFVMFYSLGLSWTLFVTPTYFLCTVLGGGIYAAWGVMTLYINVMGLGFLVRFLGGKWRSMRVVEIPAPGIVPPSLPEAPTAEVDL